MSIKQAGLDLVRNEQENNYTGVRMSTPEAFQICHSLLHTVCEFSSLAKIMFDFEVFGSSVFGITIVTVCNQDLVVGNARVS